MTRWARFLLIRRLTRSDGELTDRGQDLAEELYQGGRDEGERPDPGPVHVDARVY